MKARFGKNWCLSPEQSLLLHSRNRTVPKQLLVRSPKAQNNIVELLHGTSFFDLKVMIPPQNELEEIEGNQVYSLAAGLVFYSADFFSKYPTDARICLSMIKNPFTFGNRLTSPHATRIRLMWNNMRETVIKNIPDPPNLPADKKQYMEKVEEKYVSDAYHSLSIEGYQVSPEIIELVRSEKWNPNENEFDNRQKDAMAARGYWQAFQKVKESIRAVLNGENPGEVADKDHGDWYRELFAPAVTAGIIKATDLAGYRNSQVYIKGSHHVPPNYAAVRDEIPVLFELLQKKPEPAVRAVLVHFIFVYIHPCMNGNGRIGRFLMNVMLASGGYPWTVIPVERRDDYMSALERASVN